MCEALIEVGGLDKLYSVLIHIGVLTLGLVEVRPEFSVK